MVRYKFPPSCQVLPLRINMVVLTQQLFQKCTKFHAYLLQADRLKNKFYGTNSNILKKINYFCMDLVFKLFQVNICEKVLYFQHVTMN